MESTHVYRSQMRLLHSRIGLNSLQRGQIGTSKAWYIPSYNRCCIHSAWNGDWSLPVSLDMENGWI